jgi:hypothetical protein
MIQAEVRHAAGTFALCSGCNREPHHVIVKGRSANEAVDIRNPAPSERHQLECCRCGRVTAKHPTLAEAVDEWGAAYAQGELVFTHRRRNAA